MSWPVLSCDACCWLLLRSSCTMSTCLGLLAVGVTKRCFRECSNITVLAALHCWRQPSCKAWPPSTCLSVSCKNLWKNWEQALTILAVNAGTSLTMTFLGPFLQDMSTLMSCKCSTFSVRATADNIVAVHDSTALHRCIVHYVLFSTCWWTIFLYEVAGNLFCCLLCTCLSLSCLHCNVQGRKS